MLHEIEPLTLDFRSLPHFLPSVWYRRVAVALDPLQLIVRGDWVSETLDGFVSTSKALTFVQLPRTSPLEDLAVVSGPRIWPTKPPSYRLVNARGTVSFSLVSQGTSSPTDHLRLTPDGYIIVVTEGDNDASDY